METHSGRGIHGMTVDQIARKIVSGDLAPGSMLDPVELERDFDVSRTVIREALRVLAAKGLVDARPKRGTFVLPRDEWSLLDPDLLRWLYAVNTSTGFLDDLAEVRAIVEPAAARLAAQRCDEADLIALGDALAVLADGSASTEVIIKADLAFHRALLGATHNELLQRMELIIEGGLRARDLLVHGRENWRDSEPEHRAVFEAVQSRNPEEAEEAMCRLLEHAARDVADLEKLADGHEDAQ